MPRIGEHVHDPEHGFGTVASILNGYVFVSYEGGQLVAYLPSDPVLSQPALPFSGGDDGLLPCGECLSAS